MPSLLSQTTELTLERYLRLPAASLMPSLQAARIAVDLAARPVFLDAPAP